MVDDNEPSVGRTKYGRIVNKPKFLGSASLPPPSTSYKKKKVTTATSTPRPQRPRARADRVQSLASIVRKHKRKQKDVADRKKSKKVKFADTNVIHCTDNATQHDPNDVDAMMARCRTRPTDSDETTKSTKTVRTTVDHNNVTDVEMPPLQESQTQRQHREIHDRAAERLRHLDAAYEKLNRCEILLMEEYKRARKEEGCLLRALQLSNESGRETCEREKMAKDKLAVQRLEAALFNDDEEDDSDDSEDSGEEMPVDIDDMEGGDYPRLNMDI